MKDVEVIKARNTLSPRARTNFEKRLRVAAYCRVSTDTEDQLNSYKSQVEYYTELIKSKPEWSLAGIYADEAITGTQVKKREDFQRLINDCMNGDVDMVITKSISRFARNTLDTLKYVRMLKDKGVAVFFEEENINTLTMDGELLLVILSSVAQQEVENISANVKKGLKMKMQRGELVGFQGCLGYEINFITVLFLTATAITQCLHRNSYQPSMPKQALLFPTLTFCCLWTLPLLQSQRFYPALPVSVHS